MSTIVVNACAHKNKALCYSPTTNYPLPRIMCIDCGDILISIEEAARFVQQDSDRSKTSAKERP